MKIKLYRELFEDLANLAKKHNVTIMTGAQGNLFETTKGLQGIPIFITNGEKALCLTGGELMKYDH